MNKDPAVDRNLTEERYKLVTDRIAEIEKEKQVKGPYNGYFRRTAAFITLTAEFIKQKESGALADASLAEWQSWNKKFYDDIMGDNYRTSYACPDFCLECFGEGQEDISRLLSFLYTEVRTMTGWAHEDNKEAVTVLAELFAEIYGAFDNKVPQYDTLKEIIYWYAYDYQELFTGDRIITQLDPDRDFAVQVINSAGQMGKDGSPDLTYLYKYGEYVSETDLKMARFVEELPEEDIDKIASVYTEGYRMGFAKAGKDLSRKRTVDIRYRIGFERVVKRSIESFLEMGLKPTVRRAACGVITKREPHRIGYFGTAASRQYEYDHRQDEALFLDRKIVNRKLEVIKHTFEKNKDAARAMAGPACIEFFGEKPFIPTSSSITSRYDKRQQKLAVQYGVRSGQITNTYIPGEERSFTIISFPTPDIGRDFPEIFRKIIEINTLDCNLYEAVQQKLIDALDRGIAAKVRGMGKNHTDLVVAFAQLKDPSRETIFENCTADVNIPVGEVFTTPRLIGTNGILHVTGVFLEGLYYKELEIVFKEGMIDSYSCENYEDIEENRQYIRDNVLNSHTTLPMGEFAIGTNTLAYVTAKKYHIEDRMPILIAEKTGPHFAVGDSCYSHEEDQKVYNPDGKEIIARENDCSRLRDSDPEKAYFQCHTDITIPYDELGEITVICSDGNEIPVIQKGRFVLPGTEMLNTPFSQHDNKS